MDARRITGTAVCGVLLLSAAACSGTDGSASSDEPAWDKPASELQEFMDDLDAGHELDEGTRRNAAEEVVAACMAEQGFEYVPVDHTAEAPKTATDLGLASGSPEFAAAYGYGISTDPWGMYARGAEVEDPNAAYVEGLSPDGRTAYLAALFGVLAEPDDTSLADAQERAEAVVTSTWQEQGCYGRGEHEIDDGAFLEAYNSQSALIQEIIELESVVEADSRLAPLADDWSQCMADAGFDGYANVSEPAEELLARWQGLWMEASAQSPGGGEVTSSDASTAAVAAAVEAEMGEDEIAIAVADVDCRLSTGYHEMWNTVRLEVENDFFASRRAEFEAWAEAVAAVE